MVTLTVYFRDQIILKSSVLWKINMKELSSSFHFFLTMFPLFFQTTQLRILAGEVEPTTGDVVKSSRNLRVAFLRQEFVDELVDTNTLREELYTSFSEERELLKAISDCEDEVGRTTDDPVTMEAVLNKLQVLQDRAIAQGVYALESKVT